jgi:hypothetical protein
MQDGHIQADVHRPQPGIQLSPCHKIRYFRHTIVLLQALLAGIIETCLTTETAPFGEAEKRADLILLFKNIKCLLEAALLLKMAHISKSNE